MGQNGQGRTARDERTRRKRASSGGAGRRTRRLSRNARFPWEPRCRRWHCRTTFVRPRSWQMCADVLGLSAACWGVVMFELVVESTPSRPGIERAISRYQQAGVSSSRSAAGTVRDSADIASHRIASNSSVAGCGCGCWLVAGVGPVRKPRGGIVPDEPFFSFPWCLEEQLLCVWAVLVGAASEWFQVDCVYSVSSPRPLQACPRGPSMDHCLLTGAC
ncbi:hypothetical protein QBC39DRAFT_340317 [Podospora conica]|nr:hypothetical protein QBC39DRAFT_340317 [Schizothecium conicum]